MDAELSVSVPIAKVLQQAQSLLLSEPVTYLCERRCHLVVRNAGNIEVEARNCCPRVILGRGERRMALTGSRGSPSDETFSFLKAGSERERRTCDDRVVS